MEMLSSQLCISNFTSPDRGRNIFDPTLAALISSPPQRFAQTYEANKSEVVCLRRTDEPQQGRTASFAAKARRYAVGLAQLINIMPIRSGCRPD